ncbi:MAG: PP0621 family protein [Polaromonas sp.]
MKYALVLALVLVVFWLWRSARHASRGDRHAGKPPQNPHASTKTTEMVACQVCHVHLPRSEALTGGRGLYCSAEHRQQAGD